ncbi:response regulator [Alkalibacterium iburiense]|uniref:Response regulator n=1 Tax=Alkalibacterium iburiense TaxID=290589 RepID=A0ABN0XJE7_9LACT
MYKCIIVDDEKNIRERLAQLFPWDDYSYEVVGTAPDGLVALELAEEHKPDLVFTDIKMPNMDGLQLIEKLNRFFPETEVVILSAHSDFELAQKAIGYNVKGYLLKPIMKNDFRDIMEKIVNKEKKETIDKDNTEFSKSAPSVNPKLESSVKENEYITFAKNYVYAHYHENISIKTIANELFIHESYFSTLFNEQVGESFTSFVNEVRIEKAKSLLKYSDYQLKDIASKVGFSTPSYFNKVFKQIVGESPSSFRKKNGS